MKFIKLLPVIMIVLISGCHIIVEDVYFPANRLVGNYEVDEWSETLGAQVYFNIFIHKDPYDPDIIYIDNFYNAGIEVIADVNGSKIIIPLQIIGAYEIEGIGSYYNGELTMDYSVRDIYYQGSYIDYCNAICLKY